MSLFLSNLVLWPLLALIAVPVLIHLFARARPPVYEFSSVEFIRRILKHTLRVRKPRDWLLLILRTLAVALLVFVFLRPMLFAHAVGNPFQKRNVVVVLDSSASMGWAEGSQTRFAVACAEASETLAGLSGRDAANVILAGMKARPVFPSVGPNIAYLQGEIRRAQVTAGTVDPGTALQLAVKLLQGREGRKEICVFSDFQASNWRGVAAEIPPDIGLTCVSVAKSDAPNCAITRLVADPVRPLQGEDVTLVCEVVNYSEQTQRRTVVLGVEENRSSQETVLPPWGRATLRFRHRVTVPAPFVATVSLTDDAFPADDRRWLVVEPRDMLRVGVVGFEGGDVTAAVWSRAVRALGWARADMRDAAWLGNPSWDYDVVMLAGWNGDDPARVRRFLGKGVPVIWCPGTNTPAARLSGVLSNVVSSAGRKLEPVAWQRQAEAWKLNIATPGHALFRIFGGGEYGDPARGVIHGRLFMKAADLPTGSALLAYSDGVPALWACEGDSPLYVWNIPIDKTLSSWAAQGEFVPFLGELILSSRCGMSGLARPGNEYSPGQMLVWRPEFLVRVEDVRVRFPDGAALPAKVAETGGGLLMAGPAEQLGSYAWLIRDKVIKRDAVNFVPMESDLRPLSTPEIKAMGALVGASGRAVREWQDGITLWPMLLAAGLLILLCEGLVAAWKRGVR